MSLSFLSIVIFWSRSYLFISNLVLFFDFWLPMWFKARSSFWIPCYPAVFFVCYLTSVSVNWLIVACDSFSWWPTFLTALCHCLTVPDFCTLVGAPLYKLYCCSGYSHCIRPNVCGRQWYEPQFLLVISVDLQATRVYRRSFLGYLVYALITIVSILEFI